VKALIPVGASHPIAAAFNTPIDGVLFALEEIMGDHECSGTELYGPQFCHRMARLASGTRR
jgi:H+/Cl- antiporter ClcA